MKTSVAIIIFFFAITQGLLGQKIRVSNVIEKTIVGFQMGTQVSYRFSNSLTLGGFYQRNVINANERNQGVYEFAGVQVGVPLVKYGHLMLKGMFRAGLSNRRFVVITPTVETEIKLTSFLSTSIGVGIRAAELSANGKIIFTL